MGAWHAIGVIAPVFIYAQKIVVDTKQRRKMQPNHRNAPVQRRTTIINVLHWTRWFRGGLSVCQRLLSEPLHVFEKRRFHIKRAKFLSQQQPALDGLCRFDSKVPTYSILSGYPETVKWHCDMRPKWDIDEMEIVRNDVTAAMCWCSFCVEK